MSKITSLSIVICFLSLTFVTSCGGSLPRRDEYVKILPMTDNVITYDETKSLLAKHNIDIRPYYVPTPGTVIHAVVIPFDIDTLEPAEVTYNEVSVKMEIRDGTRDSEDTSNIEVLAAIPKSLDKPVDVEEASKIAVNVAAEASGLSGKVSVEESIKESYERLYRKVTANIRSETDVSWRFRPFKDEPIFPGTYYVIALIEVRDQTREFRVHVHSECSYGRSTLFGVLKERKDCIPHEEELLLEQPSPAASGDIGSTLVREKDGMEMVYVPGGTFEMGSTQGGFGGEYPAHVVTLDSFWMDRTEVTNAQYARCVADGTCSPPTESGSYTRDSYYGDSEYDDYPVIWVSWYDADTYCQWAGGRLPTEAEWEYAARGPDGHIYPWGDNPPDETLLNYDINVGDTTRVGSYPYGASWVYALDMAGNVYELVADWYADYPSEAQTNPKGPETGEEIVLRGGCWGDDEEYVRAANRYGDWRVTHNAAFGFRCVVEPGN